MNRNRGVGVAALILFVLYVYTKEEFYMVLCSYNIGGMAYYFFFGD